MIFRNSWMINNYSNNSVYFSSRAPRSGNAILVAGHTQRNEIVIAMNARIENRKPTIAQYAEKPSTVTKVVVNMREFIPEAQSLPRFQPQLVREKLLPDHQEMASVS